MANKAVAEEVVAANEADAAQSGEAAARSFVGDELDGAEKPDRAHLADQRVVLKFREHLGGRWPRKPLDPWNQILSLYDLEIFRATAHATGVTGERETVMEVIGGYHHTPAILSSTMTPNNGI
jgi:hypothetical protein